MRFTSSEQKVCPDTERPVVITMFVEAEGGFGCAVGADEMIYECELQENCPVRKQGRCHLQI